MSSPSAASADWPSYNRTLTSERYSPLNQINTKNVGKLKVLCTYDVDEYAAFETGLIMVEDALIGTTQFDIFSLNPATCALNWRTHEDYPPALLPANRAPPTWTACCFAAPRTGGCWPMTSRPASEFGRQTIADPKHGESVPSAPIASDGLVFVGNAGGDYKGGKGHMFALDAKTGKIVWEFFLVPKVEGDTVRGPLGATPLDMSTWKNAPGIPISGGGTWTSYTLDPKTGQLYVPGGNPAPDFASGAREGDNLYTDSVVVLDAKTGDYKTSFQGCAEGLARLGRLQPAHPDSNDGRQAAHGGRAEGWTPLRLRSRHQQPALPRAGDPGSRIRAATFAPGKDVHFCPGRWGARNGTARPTIRGRTSSSSARSMVRHGDAAEHSKDFGRLPIGQPWAGMATFNPFDMFGKEARRRDTGPDGSTPPTPTPASGSGA